MRIELRQYGRLLVTREKARSVAAALPAEAPVTLDFDGVEVASPSFLSELRRTAEEKGTTTEFVNASPRIQATLERIARLAAS